MKPRDRMVLGVLALAALMAGLWLGVLAPKREEAASVRDRVSTAEQRRDAANAKATQAERDRAGYGRDYVTFARLGKAVPPQPDVPSLVYQLESAADDAKVDFRSLSVEDEPAQAPTSGSGAKAPSSSTAGITPVSFSFTFEGSFFKLNELLRSVDRFSRIEGRTVEVRGRLLTLDGVTLSPGRNGFPQVKAEITARAYIAPIPEQLPGSGAASASGSKNPSPADRVNP